MIVNLSCYLREQRGRRITPTTASRLCWAQHEAGYDTPMNRTTASSKNQLRNIARRAMLERGLLPDFSAAVVAETRSIATAAAATDSSLRDLRHLLWASIDNDDSLDLDQLSVAEQLPDGISEDSRRGGRR